MKKLRLLEDLIPAAFAIVLLFKNNDLCCDTGRDI